MYSINSTKKNRPCVRLDLGEWEQSTKFNFTSQTGFCIICRNVNSINRMVLHFYRSLCRLNKVVLSDWSWETVVRSTSSRKFKTMAPVLQKFEDASAKIDEYIRANQVMVFSKSYCPFCNKVSIFKLILIIICP